LWCCSCGSGGGGGGGGGGTHAYKGIWENIYRSVIWTSNEKAVSKEKVKIYV